MQLLTTARSFVAVIVGARPHWDPIASLSVGRGHSLGVVTQRAEDLAGWLLDSVVWPELSKCLGSEGMGVHRLAPTCT